MSAPAVPRPLGRHAPTDLVAFGGQDGTKGGVDAATLLGAAHAVARALPPAKPGEEVIVLTRDRVAFAAALFGAWEAGYGVALPPNAQPETVKAIRDRAEVATVLHDGEGEKGIDVAPIVAGATRSDTPLAELDPTRHLATVYTSGSTGEHRGSAKTAAQLLGEAATLVATFPDCDGARVLAIVPPHHIYGLLFGVLVPTIARGAFHRDGPRDPEGLGRAIGVDRVDVLVSVPAHLRSLRYAPDGALPKVRRVFSSGAPLPADTARDLDKRAGWTITEVLGSTETGGIAWRDRGDAPAPSWQPFAGVRVEADDEERMLLDSPLLAPDAPRPYVGADRVRVLPGGRFEHLGRADGVLKVGATRVSLAELEKRLLSIDGVEDAAVLPVEVGGARGVETWAALVAPGFDAKQVRAALLAWLAPVVVPRRYRFVDALPRTENGKLRREDLLALFESPVEDDRAPAAATADMLAPREGRKGQA